MAHSGEIIPVPKSRFVKIGCASCGSESIVYTMTKSAVNCIFCGNPMAEPSGGQARIFGTVLSQVDNLAEVPVRTITSRPIKQERKTRLLVDTMIIHELVNGKDIQSLVDGIKKDTVEIIVLDRILIETVNMEKHEYNMTISSDEIIDTISKTASVEKMVIDHASESIMRARDLCESKKYVNSDGVPLSETDCILLQTALELGDDVRLVTWDKTLEDGFEKERQAAT